MKRVLLMRHAKSSWKDSSLSDHLRPLNERGKRDAPRMGRHIRDQDIRLDAILCSTATRARATVEGFLQEYTFEGEVHYYDELYLAGLDEILAVLNHLPENVETAMVIAHNPGLETCLDILCDQYEHMPTACIADIKFPIARWPDLHEGVMGELLHLWKAREH